MKRILLMIFAAVLSVSMIACASAEEPESFDTSFDGNVDLSDLDMDGYLFKIACVLHGSVNALNPSSDYEVRGDKLITKYNQLKAEHNCSFQVTDGVDLAAFKTFYYAGDMYADVILATAANMFHDGYVLGGLFIPWNTIDEIDITDQRYGSETVKEANMWLGDYYGIDAQYLQMPCADTMPAMFVNPTTIKMYGQQSPYELYENGTWDWDHLRTMCHAIYDVTSSDKNEWVLPMGYTSEPYLELACIYSNGASIITREDSGRLIYTLDSVPVRNALEFITELRADGYIMDDGDRQNIDPFCANRRAFFFEFSHLGLYSESSSNFSTRMEGEFDWITFPKGPDAEGDVISTKYSWYSRHFYLPGNVNYDYIGAIIPELFDFLPGEDRDTWEKDFYSVNFYNQESFDFYRKIRDNASFDYSVFCDFTGAIYNALKAITRGSKTITEAVTNIADSVQNDLDTRYNDYYGY